MLGIPSQLDSRVAMAASFGLLACAVGDGTFWIDEGFSAWIASHHTFASLLQSLREGDSSDLQMVLYNFYLWGWARVFGVGEYSLRAANLPFAALFVAALAWTSRLALGRRMGWMAVALSPFVWTYVNEARAYLPMMACAAASTGSLLAYCWGPPNLRRRAAWGCLGFFTLASLFHMLAAFLLPAFAVILLCEGRWPDWRDHWRKPAAVFAPILLLLGGYFLWTLTLGAGYGYGSPSVPRFLFVIYDFLGFGGLGPGRNVLRTQADFETLMPYWPTLAIGALAMGFVVAGKWSRRSRVLLAAWIAGFSGVVAAALVIHSRVLGRHASALLPLLLFFLLVQGSGRRRMACLAAVWLMSDIRLSLRPEHAKDEYRGATRYAIEESRRAGADIVWSADPLTAGYYGLRLTGDPGSRFYVFNFAAGLARVGWPEQAHGIVAGNWDPVRVQAFLRGRTRPVLLVLSKPDVYDLHGGWEPAIRQHGLTPVAVFQSFAIYLFR